MFKRLVIFLFLVASLTTVALTDPRDVFTDQRYHSALFRDFPVGISFITSEGQFLAANSALCAFLGRTENELKKLRWQDITVAQDIEVDELSAKKIITGEERSYTMFKQYIHKRGEALWARITVNGIRSSDGKFEHFVTVVEPLSGANLIDADIINKLESIQGNLSKLGHDSNESAARFIANNWQTLITWFVLIAVSIGGIVYKIRLDSVRISALEKQVDIRDKLLEKEK